MMSIAGYLRKLSICALNIILALVPACSGGKAGPDGRQLFLEAGELFRTGDAAGAAVLLEQAAAADPGNPNVWYNLGTVSLETGNYTRAVEAYSTVMALDPSRIDATTDLTAALVASGRFDEALEAGALSVRHNPRDGMAHSNYGIALLETGSPEDAARCFAAALSMDPENPVILWNWGMMLLLAGYPEEALPVLEQSCTLRPGLTGAQLDRARALGMLGRHQEAMETAMAVLATEPGRGDALELLALSYAGQGMFHEAVSLLVQLAERFPGEPGFRLGLADCLYEAGSREEALVNYRIFMTMISDTTGTSSVRNRIASLEVPHD